MIAIILVFFTVSQGITFRLLIESEQYSKGAASLIEKSTNPEKYAESVMRSWRAIPEDVRKHPESAEFKAYYEDITKQEEYRRILDILKAFYNTASVDDIYFGIYDKETSSLIFVADPDYDNPRDAVGQYEVVNDNEITAALDSDSESISYVDYTKKNGLLITGGFKVRDDDGNVVGHILVDISLGNIIRQTVRYVIRFGILMTLIGFLLAYFMSRHMRKMISNPINTIAKTAEQYTVDKMAGVEHSHYFSDITIRNGDEIENLWLVMKEMEEDLNQYEERLTKVTTEKERINTELALATKIQADTLPNVFPPFPDHQEFNIFATMKPAKEVGGDFYDFFLVDDDHLALVIADVSGKGIPAALFMMISKLLIKNHTMTIEDPAKVLEVVNDQICANN
ncbi:MAG: SpoIIE family protein phosphatase, partial [Erysipelotrichaceae bacterium]|nr:SpoIIE family protein phosphatase [Erysipelotrichaceae bacterium]